MSTERRDDVRVRRMARASTSTPAQNSAESQVGKATLVPPALRARKSGSKHAFRTCYPAEVSAGVEVAGFPCHTVAAGTDLLDGFDER